VDHLTGIDLKVRRVRARLKQYQLAQWLGIPPATLSHYENGRRPLPPGLAAAILEAIREVAEQDALNGSDADRA
jgi:DNA-binding transcriptional regulator YiaG